MRQMRGNWIRWTVAAACVAACCVQAMPQSGNKPAVAAGSAALRALKTRAERTNYAETSRYEDVIEFMQRRGCGIAADPFDHVRLYL